MSRVHADAASVSLPHDLDAKAPPATAAATAPPKRLRVKDLLVTAPGGFPLFGPVTFSVETNRPLAIVGASGSGKTTLLKQIAGWVGSEGSHMALDGSSVATSDRSAACHLCLHDAALLKDTIRTNLFAPHAPDPVIWAALETVEMAETVKARGGLDAWLSQEVLSQGEIQRLNLARALLSPKPVILMDEPWEHVESAQAERISERILQQLSGKIVLFATHITLTGHAQILDLDERINRASNKDAFAHTDPTTRDDRHPMNEQRQRETALTSPQPAKRPQ